MKRSSKIGQTCLPASAYSFAMHVHVFFLDNFMVGGYALGRDVVDSGFLAKY